MARKVDHFVFRPPHGGEDWNEDFYLGHRRSPRTGSVVIVALDEALLDELNEQRWDTSFAKSHEALSRLAAQAECDDKAGLADELDPDLL